MPTSTVNLLTERAVSAALSLGDTVVAVAVAGDEEERDGDPQAWSDWECGPPIEVLVDQQRSLIRSVLRYVESIDHEDALVTVLIPEIVPRKRRHAILHNQRGPVAAARAEGPHRRVVATLPFKRHD